MTGFYGFCCVLLPEKPTSWSPVNPVALPAISSAFGAENVQFVMAASALLGDGIALQRASAAVKPTGRQFDIAEAAQTGNRT